MGRKKTIAARWRWPAAILLLLLIGIGAVWWHFIHWMPSRQTFPLQGIAISAADGPVNLRAYKVIGANLVYIEASRGAEARDARFGDNLAQARAAHLQVGAVHIYDPCLPAERQAANFVTTVPRDEDLLPPVVSLDAMADDCASYVSPEAVESELTTFVNQIEGHAGKAAILRVSKRFQKRYMIASRLSRDLWLERDWFQPDYAGRPWTLWTANGSLRTEASVNPVHWLVVQP